MTDKEKIDKILFHIESDPSTGHVGMAEQLVLITKRVNDMETRNKVIYRVGMFFGVLFGGLITYTLKLIGIFKSVL